MMYLPVKESETTHESTTQTPDVPLDYLSDMKIVCEDRTFNVHRYKLCRVSDVFEREIRNPRFVECQGIIKHEEFDAGTVERMIQFLYHGHYHVPDIESTSTVKQKTPEETTSEEEESTEKAAAKCKRNENILEIMMAHIAVHGIALYYNIKSLASAASRKFAKVVHDHRLPNPGFVEILEAIYKHTKTDHEMLRSNAVDASLRRVEEIFGDQDFTAALQNGTTGLGEYAAEMAQCLASKRDSAEEEVRDHQNNLSILHRAFEQCRIDAQQVEKARDDAKSQLLQVGQLIYNWRAKSCRHCDAVEVKLEEQHGKYQLRCRKCRTKYL